MITGAFFLSECDVRNLPGYALRCCVSRCERYKTIRVFLIHVFLYIGMPDIHPLVLPNIDSFFGYWDYILISMGHFADAVRG